MNEKGKMKNIKKLLRKNPQKVSINSRLKVIQIIGHRRVLYRQRIPDTSYTRLETPDLDILLISRYGDRKIIQPIRTSLDQTPTKVIPIEVLRFDSEKRVQEAEWEEPTDLRNYPFLQVI